MAKTTRIVGRETHCHHFMGYSYPWTARDLYMHHFTDRTAHTMAFVRPVVECCLE